MSKPTTYVLFVTDMSGSMGALAEDVRGGFNAYIDELRKEQARLRVTVTLFDTEYIRLCTDAKLSEVPALDNRNYMPRGGTALLDAVGRTVSEKAALKLGDRALLVIQTDGYENSSREWTWPAIQALLDEKEKTGQWSIVYLGQGREAWAQGGLFGASTQVVNTSKSSRGTAATYSGLAAATSEYASGGQSRNVSQTIIGTPGVNEE